MRAVIGPLASAHVDARRDDLIRELGLSPMCLISARRYAHASPNPTRNPKHTADFAHLCWAMHQPQANGTRLSWPEIAASVGCRGHTTVLYAARRWEKRRIDMGRESK